MSQMSMGFDALERARNLLGELRANLADACDRHQRNVVAPELDLSPGYLTNLLAGKKKMSAELLLALMEFDDADSALRRMASRRGYELKRVLSAEEQLRRYREVARRRLGNVADEIEREALGENR